MRIPAHLIAAAAWVAVLGCVVPAGAQSSLPATLPTIPNGLTLSPMTNEAPRQEPGISAVVKPPIQPGPVLTLAPIAPAPVAPVPVAPVPVAPAPPVAVAAPPVAPVPPVAVASQPVPPLPVAQPAVPVVQPTAPAPVAPPSAAPIVPVSEPGRTPSPPQQQPAAKPRNQDTSPAYGRLAASTPTRQQIIRLRNLGRRDGIRLEGTLDEASAAFSVRQDEVFVGSRVSLTMSFSAAIARHETELTVLVNNEPIGVVPMPKGRGEGKTRAEFTFSPALLGVDNRLQLRLNVKGMQSPDVCRLPKERQYWVKIEPESFVYLNSTNLTVADDLVALPRPFADPKDPLELSLPFVLPRNASPEIVHAATIAAGYFGIAARHKGASFPVTFGALPAGHAVVFVLGNDYPTGVAPLPGSGPRIGITPNPAQVDSKLLLIVGANAAELRRAALTLAYNSSGLEGPWKIAAGNEPDPRIAYDSPNWVASDRPVRLGDIVDQRTLAGFALKDVVQVPFRVAPDLFFKNVIGAPLSLRIERAPESWIESKSSKMYVGLNGARITDVQLEARLKVLSRLKEWLIPGPTDSRLSHVFLPSYQLFSSNLLELSFDLRALPDADCFNLDWSDRTGIDPNSFVDFSTAMHFVALPNLALFSNSGFPFTKFADLATTAFVLPDRLAPQDVEAVLNTVGHIAYLGGVAPVRHAVVPASRVESVADRDLIVVGTLDAQPLHRQWEQAAAARETNGDLVPVSPMGALERFLQPRDWREPSKQGNALELAKQHKHKPSGTISSFWSPLNEDRLVVALAGTTPAALVDVSTALRNVDLSSLIQGDFFYLSEGEAGFYSSGRRKFVGELSFWNKVQWVIGAYGFAAFIATVFSILLMAFSVLRLAQYRAARRLEMA